MIAIFIVSPRLDGHVNLCDTSRLNSHTNIRNLVYQEICVCLHNLASIRDFVRDTHDGDQPLISTVEEINSHSWLAVKLADFSRFPLDQTVSSQELIQSAQKARTWLLQIISTQSNYDRSHFIRLFRSTLETDSGQWTDLQHLYHTVTNPKIGDAAQRLRVAFAICLQGNFANKYALELSRSQQSVYLRGLPHSSYVTPAILSARHRLADKTESSKIDSFACAVPLFSIHASTCEAEKECPICRESYLPFTDNSISTINDLLADYPVRIKYCGHVVGKYCLEMWWGTPNKNLAKFPFKTCPLCRTKISDREGEEPELSKEMMHRIRHSRFVRQVRESTGMEEEDVVVGVKMGMSEGIAVLELVEEVKRVKRIGSVEGEVVKETEMALEGRLIEVRKEREVWRIPDYLYDRARREWMEASLKR
jgi:hypothetical protein